jgi:hypothetical protein
MQLILAFQSRISTRPMELIFQYGCAQTNNLVQTASPAGSFISLQDFYYEILVNQICKMKMNLDFSVSESMVYSI